MSTPAITINLCKSSTPNAPKLPFELKIFRYLDGSFYVEYAVEYEEGEIDNEIGGTHCPAASDVLELVQRYLDKGIAISA